MSAQEKAVQREMEAFRRRVGNFLAERVGTFCDATSAEFFQTLRTRSSGGIGQGIPAEEIFISLDRFARARILADVATSLGQLQHRVPMMFLSSYQRFEPLLDKFSALLDFTSQRPLKAVGDAAKEVLDGIFAENHGGHPISAAVAESLCFVAIGGLQKAFSSIDSDSLALECGRVDATMQCIFRSSLPREMANLYSPNNRQHRAAPEGCVPEVVEEIWKSFAIDVRPLYMSSSRGIHSLGRGEDLLRSSMDWHRAKEVMHTRALDILAARLVHH